MPGLSLVPNRAPATSTLFNNIITVMTGQPGIEQPIRFTQLLDPTNYALTVRNRQTGGTGSKALRVEDGAGNLAFDISALGGGGPNELLIGAYFPETTKVTIGNVRNWAGTSDLFVTRTRNTAGTTTSFVPATFIYETACQPIDGFNGTNTIPDEAAASFIALAKNTASGAGQNQDGALMASEHVCVVFAGTGKKRSHQGLIASVHTAEPKVSYLDNPVTYDDLYGDVGIAITSTPQSWPGYGTAASPNIGLLIVSGLKFKFGLAYLDADNSTLWSVDQFGTHKTGSMIPTTSGSKTLGNVTFKYGQVWGSTLIAANGAAATPSIALGDAATEGLYREGSGIGFSVGSTERARIDASAFQFAQGVRYVGIVTPPQITTSQNNYNPTGLGTARILRINASTPLNITGITALASGTVLSLVNVGSSTITLTQEDAASTAQNRFNLPGAVNLALTAQSSVQIFYDAALTRWLTLS